MAAAAPSSAGKIIWQFPNEETLIKKTSELNFERIKPEVLKEATVLIANKTFEKRDTAKTIIHLFLVSKSVNMHERGSLHPALQKSLNAAAEALTAMGALKIQN